MIYIYFCALFQTKSYNLKRKWNDSLTFFLQTGSYSAIHVYTCVSLINEGGKLWDYLEEI